MQSKPTCAASWTCSKINSTGVMTIMLTSGGNRVGSISQAMNSFVKGNVAIKPRVKTTISILTLFRRYNWKEPSISPPGESSSSSTALTNPSASAIDVCTGLTLITHTHWRCHSSSHRWEGVES